MINTHVCDRNWTQGITTVTAATTRDGDTQTLRGPIIYFTDIRTSYIAFITDTKLTTTKTLIMDIPVDSSSYVRRLHTRRAV